MDYVRGAVGLLFTRPGQVPPNLSVVTLEISLLQSEIDLQVHRPDMC